MRNREIHTEIEIDAPPAHVWAVLTDFSRYGQWNPFIREIRGAARPGEVLSVTVQPPGTDPMVFRTRVTQAAPAGELAWVGRLPVPGLLSGEHSFMVAPAGDGRRSRFIQHENFSGLLLPLFGADVEDATRRGFEAMNAALKAEAERDAGRH